MQENKQLKQQQKQAQDGRSMVEMLGVLAIIGVISLGGIAGYKMAMDRYQANQIANEINLIRNDMKMKVAQGADLFLGEPYDNDGEELGHLSLNEKYKVDFGFNNDSQDPEEEEETEDEYFISVSNISEGVCKPLVTLLDSMEDTEDIKVNEVDYYDTDWNICATENKIEVAFSTTDLGVVNDEEDEPMTTAVTFTTTTATPTTPTPTTPMPTTPTATAPITTTPITTTAAITTETATATTIGKNCTTDDDCLSNQFCMLSCSCSNGVETSCRSYRCMDIGEPQKVEVDGETYYYTDNVLMELWNAKRYCQALGRQGKGTGQMVSLSELGCTATAKTVDCSGSALIKKLQEKNAGRRALWTKPSDDSENSCKAYVIVPGSNRDFYQESGGFDTLCK